jgi:transposase
MSCSTLLPDAVELRLERVVSESHSISLVVEAARPLAYCPSCRRASSRRHSRYIRRLADLPWNGVRVRIELHTRKFFCDSLSCSRRIFTERLPGTAASYARCTSRLNEALRQIAFVAGGEAGARLALRLGMGTSGDTLLRRMRQFMTRVRLSPRVLGVDDWAWRRGQRYGTLLVDLEQRSVIDLLPDRSAESFAAWLQAHPGVEIVSRDRAGCYAEGATNGAPQAVQVADRWHLLRNLSEAVQRVVEREQKQLASAAAIVNQEQQATAPVLVTSSSAPVSRPPARAEQVSQQRRNRRLARYREAMRLREAGSTQQAVARKLSLSMRTIRRWEQAGQFPERAPVAPKRKPIDRWVPYLERRWREGCHNALALWRELRQQGYKGSRGSVQRWATQQRHIAPPVEAKLQWPTFAAPSPRQATWWLLQEPDKRGAKQNAFVHACEQLSPAIAETARQAREFAKLLRQRKPQGFTDWLVRNQTGELRRFVTGLRQDEAAVRAALTLPWSNGPVEGHVHRLKLLKRQMFGRAKFDLLKQRMLYAAA